MLSPIFDPLVFDPAIFSTLSGLPMEESLFDLVSDITQPLVPAGAVGWFTVPQGVGYPRVVLNIITGSEGLTMNGPNGLQENIVQADVYSNDRAECLTVSRAISAGLHGYKGGGFSLIIHDSTRQSREGGSNEAERPYRVSMDFTTGWSAN